MHDKEFLTIIDGFEDWHHLLEGVKIIMYSNHKFPLYFVVLLMYLINVKLNRHYNCLNFGLLSFIILGDKGIWIIPLVIQVVWLRKEIKLLINNVMFSSWNSFDMLLAIINYITIFRVIAIERAIWRTIIEFNIFQLTW